MRRYFSLDSIYMFFSVISCRLFLDFLQRYYFQTQINLQWGEVFE